MKKNELEFTNDVKFGLFDTVEIVYPDEWTSSKLLKEAFSQQTIKGFILGCDIRTGRHSSSSVYDNVAVGFKREESPSYFGNNIIINTTRMVLVEKYDFRMCESWYVSYVMDK